MLGYTPHPRRPLLWMVHNLLECILFTTRKRSLQRLCFYRYLSTGGCVACSRGHAWQGGGCGGHAWQGACMTGGCVGGMHGRVVCMGGGACLVGGMHGREGCMPQQTLRDTVNERAVRILLECILVAIEFPNQRRCRPPMKILDPPLLIQNLNSPTSISHIILHFRGWPMITTNL